MQDPIRFCVDAQFASPCAMSVFVAPHEKQIEFEMVSVDEVPQRPSVQRWVKPAR